MNNLEKIISENKLRQDVINSPYDPYTGVGSLLEREAIEYSYRGKDYLLNLPVSMFEIPAVQLLHKQKSIESILKGYGAFNERMLDEFHMGFIKERLRHDFEFWSATIAKIKPKTEDSDIDKLTEVPFILNRAQRKLLLKQETMRLNNEPIRILLVKARQWGGSTETQMYAGWIQIEHIKGWNSSIVADVKEQAAGMRRMYERLLDSYPSELQNLTWTNFQGQQNVKYIKERDFTISIGSMQRPETIRSSDIRIFHGTEIASWVKTKGKSPEDLMQSIEGTLPEVPYSFSTLESTAKGVGNYFHKMYLLAMNKETNYKLVFIPWFDIDKYSRPLTVSAVDFVKSMSEYEQFLWDEGATLEAINWYRIKSKSINDEWRMKSEYPTTAEEAFQSTGRPVFHQSYISKLNIHTGVPYVIGILEADAVKGAKALMNITFLKLETGYLKVWSNPVPYSDDPIKYRYCVSLDIGGASKDADKSIITVIDRIWMIDGDGELEVVASGEFNIDQDLTVWMAIQVAKWYNGAMFIPESNSMDTEADTEGHHFLTVLDEIVDYYPNIYMRTTPEDIRNGIPAKYGFQTNKQTKTMVIDNHRALLREGKFIEREPKSISEHQSYEHKEGNKMGAAGKMHDDYVMSRAIGSWCASKHMKEPERVIIDKESSIKKLRNHSITGEATI